MEASSHTTPSSAPKKKSGKGLIIVLVLLVLIAAGVVVFRKQIVPPVKDFFTSLFHKKEMVVETTEPRTESVTVPDSMNFTEPLPSEKETSSIPAGKRYYIIAGSFVQEVNADKYVTRLQQQGYEATKIPRQKKNMYAVGCISYDSQKEALSQLNHYRNKVHPQAWVLGY
jgi:cell division septation protein DedD